MILLVTYDLKGREGGYDPLFELLKKQEGWSHYMTSTWLVSTEKTPKELLEELKPHLNIQPQGGDIILITKFVKSAYAGWAPKAVWDWVRKQEEKREPEPAEHGAIS